jgi:hypothetical protein
MVSNVAAPPVPARGQLSAALSARRWLLIAAPVLAGLLAIVGAVADPAVGEDGRPLWQKYADNPDPLQWKSFGFHWAYAFWTMGAFMLAGLVRTRGVWIANVAGLLAFVGATTLPGLLVVDFYDSAIGQVAGVGTTEQVNDLMEDTMWGITAIAVPGVVGFLLCLPVAAFAAWRAGFVRWWAPLAVLGGQAAFMLSGVAPWGVALTTVCFTAFAYALAQVDREVWQLRSS